MKHCTESISVFVLRVEEGVEYFLDLLASLHSNDQYPVRINTPTGTNIKLFNV